MKLRYKAQSIDYSQTSFWVMTGHCSDSGADSLGSITTLAKWGLSVLIVLGIIS